MLRSSIKSIEPAITPKLAFALLVHDEETIEGAIEIMEVLYPSEHCFLIHFDRSTAKESIEMFTLRYPFVHVTEFQLNIEWGKFSMVEAELELLKLSFRSPCNFDHLMFLDGHSYPMQRLFELELKFMTISRSNSIVFSSKLDYGTDIPTCLDSSPTKHACARTPARCLSADCLQYTLTPGNSPIYKGPQWTVLSSDFIDYLIENKQWLDAWIKFFSNTSMPDESFFQTLLMDSPYKGYRTLLSDDWMKTVWKNCKTYITSRSRIGYSPCQLGIEDYEPHLMNSTSYFARKILPHDKLKEKMLN